MVFPVLDVVTIAITGAAGQIGYSLVPMIARGNMLGPHQKVALRLLDIDAAANSLRGLTMELEDCALPTLAGVVTTADPRVAFEGADICIMCGAFPRKPGMERKDLLLTNAKIFSEQGAIIGEVAAPHCRVLVVGNPANTNALILALATGGKLNVRNISALTRLDHNRALTQIALRAGGSAATLKVKNAIIWGNHSGTQVPDVTFATIDGTPVREALKGDAFFDGEFITNVQQRGAEVMKLRGLSSATSAAKAIVDHVNNWILGTPEGEFVSMAVISDGNPYGIPDGLMFSFPVRCSAGEWKIVEGLEIAPRMRELIGKTTEELQEEKAQAGH